MDSYSVPSLRHTLDPLRIVATIWRDREVIAQLVRREVQSSYRESVLGTVWLFAQPLLSLAVYAFVFIVIFTPRIPQGGTRVDFVLEMFAGMIVFWGFSEVIARSPMLILSRRGYVKNIVFPLEVLPVSVLGSALVGLLAGVLILLTAVGIYHHTISPTIPLFLLVLVPLVLLTMGTSWLLASVGVFLRDIQQGVRAVLQLLFFATPIVWNVGSLPEEFRPWALLNPLASIVEGTRQTLVQGLPPDWGPLLLTTAFSLVVFVAGYTWFVRTRHGFADVM